MSVALGALVVGPLAACGSTTADEPTPADTPSVAAVAPGAASGTSRPKPKRSPAATKAKKTVVKPTTKRAPVPSKRAESARPRTAPALPTKKASAKKTVRLSDGVSVSLGTLRTIKIKPETPGEVAGSAVSVKISISNRGKTPIDLDSAVVSLVVDKGDLGIATTAGDPKPLQGDLRSGDRAHGVYVFMLDPAGDRTVKVSVNYAAGAPVALFSGRTP